MPASALAPEVPTLVLDPTDRAPGLARRFLAEQFREWGIKDDSDGRLVISELVTNSYLHGTGRITVRLFLDEHDGLPVVEVSDEGDGRPVALPEDHDEIGGRGLLTVARLGLTWGTRRLEGGGKLVWVKLAG